MGRDCLPHQFAIDLRVQQAVDSFRFLSPVITCGQSAGPQQSLLGVFTIFDERTNGTMYHIAGAWFTHQHTGMQYYFGKPIIEAQVKIVIYFGMWTLLPDISRNTLW